MDYSVNPAEIAFWGSISLPRSPVVNMAEHRCLDLAARDYSDLTNDIPMIGGISVEDRRKDPEEEYVRELMTGDLNKVYAEWSYKFYNYLHSINENNLSFINKSTNGVNLITVAFYLVYIIIVVWEVLKMRQFYKKLFQIEVRIIEIFIFIHFPIRVILTQLG
jgi:hypothetical protein